MFSFARYGHGQKLAFGMLLFGFCVCLVSSLAPYWIRAKVGIRIYDKEEGLHPDVVKVSLGIWALCLNTIVDGNCTVFYSPHDTLGVNLTFSTFVESGDWIMASRATTVVSLMLSLLCGFASGFMRCSGVQGRTTFHGALSFFSAAFGVVTVGIVCANTKSLTTLPLMDVSLGWAFWFYVVGTGIIAFTSLLFCISPPKELEIQMVQASGSHHFPAEQQPTSQYELLDEMDEFN